VRRVIAGLILSGFVSVLSGCAYGVYSRTPVRDMPDEVKAKLSIGDTRQKVHSVLGAPLVDARSLGVELYRQSGRDIEIFWVILPILLPDLVDKVIGYVLVAYDENEIVKDIATNVWPDGRSSSGNFWITAGEFSFINIGIREPRTLLGPSIYWQELAGMAVPEGSCSLVLLMRKCPMEQVSLDADLIVDLKDFHSPFCGHFENQRGCHGNLCGTFIQKIIPSGIHHLKVFQESPMPDAKFETVFECAPGETIYAELEVHIVDDRWHGSRLEGEISVKKSIPLNAVEMGNLRPIIWHHDTWCVPSNNSGAYGR
jgi:hypothetical protein